MPEGLPNQNERLRVKFKEVGVGVTFSIPGFEDYRKFLIYTKTNDGNARWAGFKEEYKDHGISSRALMSHQGETIEMRGEEEVEIGYI